MNKVIVFGKGEYSKRHIDYIKGSYDVVAILDNSIERNKTGDFKNIKCYNPLDYEHYDEYPIFVLVYKYMEVVEQLINLGVESKNIFILDVIKNEEYRYIKYSNIVSLKSLDVVPVHEDWGYRRGTPIGRVYIDDFLDMERNYIVGDVMEVSETTYSEKFSNPKNVKSITAIHVDDVYGCRKANLETFEGLREKEFDTMIITQTLAYIYNLNAVAKNIHKALKNGGYAFITVSDIGHMGRVELENYGAYWGFHKDGCKKLFSNVFGEENVNVYTYGNAKTAICQLYGLCAEDLDDETLRFHDPIYPMIIGIVVHKV